MTETVFNFIFWGDPASGKSTLIKSLLDIPFQEAYKKTVGMDFLEYFFDYSDTDTIKIRYWDTGIYKDSFFNSYTRYASKNKVVIYCCDESKAYDLEKIKRDLQEIGDRFPGVSVLLVGTKTDLLADNVSQFSEIYNAYSTSSDENTIFFKEAYSLSAKTQQGDFERLKQHIIFACILEKLKDDSEPAPIPEEGNGAEEGSISNLPANEQLTLLMPTLWQSFSLLLQKKIAVECEVLLANLADPKQDDKEKVITQFESNCKRHLLGSWPKCRLFIKAIVVSAVISAVVGLIGFGIGFALGAWSGPGAILSGLLVSTAGIGLLLGSGAVGVAAGGAFLGWGFFKSQETEKMVSDCARQVSDAYTKHPERLSENFPTR